MSYGTARCGRLLPPCFSRSSPFPLLPFPVPPLSRSSATLPPYQRRECSRTVSPRQLEGPAAPSPVVWTAVRRYSPGMPEPRYRRDVAEQLSGASIAMMPARIGSWSVAPTPMSSVIPASLPTELWVSWHTACTYHFGGCLHFRRAQNPKAMLTTEMTAVRMIISQESSTCYHSCTQAV